MTDTAARQQFETETILKLRNPSAHRLGAQAETLACGQHTPGIRNRQENSVEIPIHHFTEAPQKCLSIGIFRVPALVFGSRMDWSQHVHFTKSVSHRPAAKTHGDLNCMGVLPRRCNQYRHWRPLVVVISDL